MCWILMDLSKVTEALMQLWKKKKQKPRNSVIMSSFVTKDFSSDESIHPWKSKKEKEKQTGQVSC